MSDKNGMKWDELRCNACDILQYNVRVCVLVSSSLCFRGLDLQIYQRCGSSRLYYSCSTLSALRPVCWRRTDKQTDSRIERQADI